MKIRNLLLAILLLGVTTLLAAPFKNVEKILTQPDGTELHCFASGDEFYHRLHDADGYTIVQAENGYFVYATNDADGNVVATRHIAGKSDPKALGLKPNVMISQKEYQKRRDAMRTPEHRNSRNLNHGVYNNLVIYIKFKGDSDLTTTKTEIDSMLNYDGYHDISMNNYFKKATYNKLSMKSYSFPIPDGNKLIAYEDIYPRNYYQPYNPTTNPEGYTDQAEREFQLLKRAVEYVADQVPDTLDIDRDNDGYIDNIIFVVKGTVGDWSDLLWPHKWSMYGEEAYINGKLVGTFNFQLETSSYFSVSTLCHEMAHSLSLPDLYHYLPPHEYLSPSGPWDLMCANANPPQHTSTYMKYKYGSWIDEIPEITYGTYTIEANSWEGGRRNCYKIPSSHPDQFYLIEYRNKDNFFERGLPNGGLLIYRIDSRFDGCADYDGVNVFDEVYIFRPGGRYNSDGDINSASFCQENLRTEFNHTTSPFPFLNKNTPDLEFNICNISTRGDNMTFTYCPINTETIPKNLIANIEGPKRNVELVWDSVASATSYNIYRDGVLLKSDVVDNCYQDEYDRLTAGHHTYHVTSNCDGEESYHSNVEHVIIGSYCEYTLDMTTSGENGWQGGEILLSFDDNNEDMFHTLYSKDAASVKMVLPTDINMKMTWLSGWDDSECHFTISNNGDMVYQSGELKEGTLGNITTSGTTAVTPKNITAKIERSSVHLDWTSYVETESFTVMRNGEIIAENVTETEFIDKKVPGHGTHRYSVVANNKGHISEPSEEVLITVMLYNHNGITLNGNINNNTVTLDWDTPDLQEGVIKYCDDEYVTNLGTNSNSWGIMIPASNLAAFEDSQLSHIEIYDNYKGKYTFKIYNDDEISNNNPIHTETLNTTASNSFIKMELSEKVDFDSNKNLWITVKASGGNTAPIPCGDYCNEPNSNLIKIGSGWYSATEYDMAYSWMLKAYTTPPQNQTFTYDLYRQGTMIASGLKSNSYTDSHMLTEETCYNVEAVYNGIMAITSNDACIEADGNISSCIFPNPTDDIIHIIAANIRNITIISATGDIVFSEDINGNRSDIEVGHLNSGVYVVRVTTSSETITEKIVVY